MDSSVIAKKYIDAVQNNQIQADVLVKLPELITCSNWLKVEIVGSVDYVSERTKVRFNGLIVKFNGGLYFVKSSVVEALKKIDKRFAKQAKPITVI